MLFGLRNGWASTDGPLDSSVTSILRPQFEYQAHHIWWIWYIQIELLPVVNNKENWNKNQRGVCPIFLLFLGGRGPLGGGRPVTHWHSYPGLGIMHKRNWCYPKQSEQWLTLWWRPLLCRTGDRIRNSWDQHFRTLFAVTTWTLFYE